MSDIFKIDNSKIVRNDISTIAISPARFFIGNSGTCPSINDTGVMNLDNMPGQTVIAGGGGGDTIGLQAVVPIISGGTNAITALDARTNLGLANLEPLAELEAEPSAIYYCDHDNGFSDVVFGNSLNFGANNRDTLNAVKTISVSLFGPTVLTTTGIGLAYFHVSPSLSGLSIRNVHAMLITTGTGNTTDLQIIRTRASTPVNILSTVLTIDSAEQGSDTAVTPAVINSSNDDLATNDILSFNVNAVHSTPGRGLVLTLEAY